MTPIRVLIADDHLVVRRGLQSMLANITDICVVGEAVDGHTTLELTEKLQPDVILLDIRMPDKTGLEVARQLRRDYPAVKIIILTTFERDGYFHSALKFGVHAYLLKDTAHRDLVQAIRAVHAGQRVAGPGLMDKLWQHFETGSSENALLTEEEIEILGWLAEGMTNREIALEKYWSEASVKRKLQCIFNKLGVTRRTEAVAKALREKYI